MGRRFINQLKENEAVIEIYQIADRYLRTNKNGNLYLQFVLSDRSGSLDGRLWNASERDQTRLEPGCFAAIEGTVQRFQGSLQIIAKKINVVSPEKLNLNDFDRGHRIDIPGRLRKVKELLHEMKNPDLVNLADAFLMDETFMKAFCDRPAGVKLHHAVKGGLLEHTSTMMETAKRVGEIYSGVLDSDLLLLGTFLHDIGKTEELSTNGSFSYTDVGQILGHPLLGVEILNRKIQETEKLTGTPFPAELGMLLKHLILAHHGTLENGSAKVPMTTEALALHFIDSMDAKLAEFAKDLAEDPNLESHWTNFIPALDRKLYKKQYPFAS